MVSRVLNLESHSFFYFMVGIYKITNPIGQIYIGQSIDIDKRWNGYKKYGAPGQPKLQASFKKYGAEAHIFSIVCEGQYYELNSLEIFYIKKHKAINGLNAKIERYIGAINKKTKEEISQIFQMYLTKQLVKKHELEKAKSIQVEKQKIRDKCKNKKAEKEKAMEKRKEIRRNKKLQREKLSKCWH